VPLDAAGIRRTALRSPQHLCGTLVAREAIFETLETAVDPSGDGSEIPTVSTRIDTTARPIIAHDTGGYGGLLRSPIISLKIFICAELTKSLEPASFTGDLGETGAFTRRRVDLNLLGNK
jgi:hypothetical protein